MMEYTTLEMLENEKGKERHNVKKIRQEFQCLQFIVSFHKIVLD